MSIAAQSSRTQFLKKFFFGEKAQKRSNKGPKMALCVFQRTVKQLDHVVRFRM